jgi:hypothetical protein
MALTKALVSAHTRGVLERLTLPEEGSNKVGNLCRNRILSQAAQESGLVMYIAKNPYQ